MQEPLVYELTEPIELGGKDKDEEPLRITSIRVNPPKMKDLAGLGLGDPDWEWALHVIKRCSDVPRQAVDQISAQDSYRLIQEVLSRFFPRLLGSSGTSPESSQTDGDGDHGSSETSPPPNSDGGVTSPSTPTGD